VGTVETKGAEERGRTSRRKGGLEGEQEGDGRGEESVSSGRVE
jgi:hypothetical protein